MITSMKVDRKKFLSKEEELECGRKIQAGLKAAEMLADGRRRTKKKVQELQALVEIGENAQDVLIEANLGLVYSRVNQYKRTYAKSGADNDDLIQDGLIGLMTAVRKYDPDMNNKFSTMAYFWVWQAVTRSANRNGNLVHLPANRTEVHTKIMAIEGRPELKELPRSEIDKVVIAETGIDPDLLRAIRGAASPHLSLDWEGHDSDSATLDFAAHLGRVTPSTESEVLAVVEGEQLGSLVMELDEVQRDCLLVEFEVPGLLGTDLNAVRAKHGLLPGQVSSIRENALGRLRELSEEERFASLVPADIARRAAVAAD